MNLDEPLDIVNWKKHWKKHGLSLMNKTSYNHIPATGTLANVTSNAGTITSAHITTTGTAAGVANSTITIAPYRHGGLLMGTPGTASVGAGLLSQIFENRGFRLTSAVCNVLNRRHTLYGSGVVWPDPMNGLIGPGGGSDITELLRQQQERLEEMARRQSESMVRQGSIDIQTHVKRLERRKRSDLKEEAHQIAKIWADSLNSRPTSSLLGRVRSAVKGFFGK